MHVYIYMHLTYRLIHLLGVPDIYMDICISEVHIGTYAHEVLAYVAYEELAYVAYLTYTCIYV